jgi:catalase
MLHGTFTPTAEAKKLSSAPHFHADSTPITVRFSNSTGVPMIPDNEPNADPRGIAVRFNLGGRKHTDVIAHSTPFFPTRTGGEFLEFLKALISSPPDTPSPSPIEKFLGSHPKALAFAQAPKPPPSSFSREAYFGVTALKFLSAEGKSTYFRYRIVPDQGIDTLGEAAAKEKGPNYLFEEVEERVKKGPFTFKLLAQLAEEGDVTDDATIHWPESRPLVELGSVKVDSLVENSNKEQKHVIMDPIPRVQGIEPSDDPLLELRAALYLISGRQRRAAE